MSDPLSSPSTGGYAQAALLEDTSDKTMVIVVYALYLAGYVTGGFSTVVGLVMAYVLDGGASPIARSHYAFLRRTFWLAIGFLILAAVIFTIGIPLSIVLIGIPLLLLAKLIGAVVAIWYGVRCVVGLITALDNRAHAAPRTWLI